jgi:hypothetical protein
VKHFHVKTDTEIRKVEQVLNKTIEQKQNPSCFPLMKPGDGDAHNYGK